MSYNNDPVGPFGAAGKFAESMVEMLIFNTTIFELMDWAKEVEIGMNDDSLPAEVRAQVLVDYKEIQRKFSQLSGSMFND